jgi:predicted PurR-regulated permease PerM
MICQGLIFWRLCYTIIGRIFIIAVWLDDKLTNTPWSRTTRIIVIIAGVIGLVWLIIAINPLIQSLVIAALLAYLLEPAVQWLKRHTRFNYVWAARLGYGLFLGLLAAIPAVLSTVALSQFNRLETDFLAALEEFKYLLTQPLLVFGVQFQPLTLLDNLAQSGGNAVAGISGSALNALVGVTTNLLWGLTVLVSLYYFLVDGPRIKPWLVGLVAPPYQAEVRLLLDEVDRAWRIFLQAQLIIFIIFVALLGGSIVLVVWLYRAGLLPLSPFGLIILLVIIYTIVQNIDNVVVRPYFFGGSLRLHPGLVFVGLIGGLAFGGVLGVIIVVPILATVKIIGRYVHRRLLGLPPWPHLAPADSGDDERPAQSLSREDEPAPAGQTLPSSPQKRVSQS